MRADSRITVPVVKYGVECRTYGDYHSNWYRIVVRDNYEEALDFAKLHRNTHPNQEYRILLIQTVDIETFTTITELPRALPDTKE